MAGEEGPESLTTLAGHPKDHVDFVVGPGGPAVDLVGLVGLARVLLKIGEFPRDEKLSV